MADWGTAQTFDELSLPIENHEVRRTGTDGYYVPEQFTKRWDYKDWNTSSVAGLYTSKSNIWGVGAVMYHLITCQNGDPVDITKPYIPEGKLFGEPSKGVTYGQDLETYIRAADDAPDSTYSVTLIHTVLEMLYEKPENRPSLFELKERAVKIIALFDEDDYEV